MANTTAGSCKPTSIELYYYTGWELPLILYTSIDSTNKDWAQKQLEFTGRCGWYKTSFTFESCRQGVEFVISDSSKTHWDNPSDTSTQRRGRNYCLIPNQDQARLKSSRIPQGVERYSLVNGVLTCVHGKPIFLATDLDGTLLGHDVYLERFNEIWLQRHAWRGSILVYSTGRNLKNFLTVAARCKLVEPDYAICGVGTEIYSFCQVPSPSNSVAAWIDPSLHALPSATTDARALLDPASQDMDIQCPKWCPSRQHAYFDQEWLETMRVEFNRSEVEMTIRSFPGEFYINGNLYHDPFRLSVSARFSDIVEMCRTKPAGSIGLHSTLGIHTDAITEPKEYEGGMSQATMTEISFQYLIQIFEGYKLLLSGAGDFRYLDILPKSGGKLYPLLKLILKTGFDIESSLVCGDSGNDVDMFAHPSIKGVCVANSQAELKDFLSGKQGLATLRGLKPTPYAFVSKFPNAGGIIEALEHFNFDSHLCSA